MLGFDFVHLLFVALPALGLSLAASAMTKSAFAKYSNVRTQRGITGAQAAQALLDRAGIHDVNVVPTSGFLSDHYNPLTKTLALSEPVYHQTSVAAVGVACHEAGHAIQHATKYFPLWARSAIVPAAGIGSNLGILVATIGIMLSAQKMILVGAALFSLVVLFQLITLPVEFDASARAKKLAYEYGLVTTAERAGVNRVLNAAAMTYVAAAVGSILNLLYFLFRAGLFGRRE
jgi:uncharacterized protein